MSMFLEEKKKIIDAGIKLDRYGLISLAGGNVSMRMPTGDRKSTRLNSSH